MKTCKECNTEYEPNIIIGSTHTYCSIICKKNARIRVQKIYRENRKEKMTSDNVDFIANDIYMKYKNRSPKRNLSFSLTVEFFKQHFRVPCYYCGETIKNIGFDRLDNSIGYTKENSVPCCSDCNTMKHTVNFKEFIKKCKIIATRFN